MVSPVEANKGKLASVFKTAWNKTDTDFGVIFSVL